MASETVYFMQGREYSLAMNFLRWVRAVVTHWYGWLGGAFVAVLLLIVQELLGWHLRTTHYVALLGFGLMWSVYEAWSDEYEARKAAEKGTYDGRPLFVLGVSNSTGQVMFTLTNCGTRPARFVRLEGQRSQLGNYALHFREILSLAPNHSAIFDYWVDNSTSCDYSMLLRFVHDIAEPKTPQEKAALTWWDIPVAFRDTDESIRHELVRLCFDFESGQFFSTAVPYTAQERKQQ